MTPPAALGSNLIPPRTECAYAFKAIDESHREENYAIVLSVSMRGKFNFPPVGVELRPAATEREELNPPADPPSRAPNGIGYVG